MGLGEISKVVEENDKEIYVHFKTEPKPYTPFIHLQFDEVDSKLKERLLTFFDSFELCAVCQEKDGEQRYLLLCCSHTVHKACLDPWLDIKKECPLCRAPTPKVVTDGDDSSAFRRRLASTPFR